MERSRRPALRVPLLPSGTFPAAVLAVSLAAGCLTGRLPSGVPVRMAVFAWGVTVTAATACPNPATLAAAGFLSGVVRERLVVDRWSECGFPAFPDATIRGMVRRTAPGDHGSTRVSLEVTHFLSTERTPVRFTASLSMPADAGTTVRLYPGDRVTVRAGFEAGPALSAKVAGSLRYVLKHQGGGIVYAARRRVADAISVNPAPTAGLLAAIALGERHLVCQEIRDILRRSGTYHLLAVSGVHIGAAAVLPFLAIRYLLALLGYCAVGWNRALVAAAAGSAALYYLSLTGSSPSAARAFLFLLFLHLAAAGRRSPFPSALLAWCAVIIIVFSPVPQPEPALAMSVLAVAGILAASGGPGGAAGRAVRAALGAALFTTPVAVWFSRGISLAGPAANLLLSIPFGVVLIPWAVLMDALALWPGAVLSPMVRAWEWAAGVFLADTALMIATPWSFLPLSWAGCAAATAASVAAVVVWRIWGWGTRQGAVLFAAVALVSAAVNHLDEGMKYRDVTVIFPALGQADGAVIRASGLTILVDCGRPGSPGSSAAMARALEKLGVRRVDALFLTHPHPDHVGGFEEVAARWAVRRVFLPGDHRSLDDWRGLLDKVPVGTRVRFLLAGDTVSLEGLHFRILAPADGAALSADPNGGSLVLLVEADGFRGLFTGDAPWRRVAGALELCGPLDLVKVPHHGSANGFDGAEMAAALAPVNGQRRAAFLCPSPLPGRGILPSRVVADWFESRGMPFLYPGYSGITIRFKKGIMEDTRTAIVDKAQRF